MEPDAKASDYKDLLAEALAFAGFEGDAKSHIELKELLDNRPKAGDCQLEFLKKRLRLASLLFMGDQEGAGDLRKLMAACRLMTPMVVLETMVSAGEHRGDEPEHTKENINVLIGTAVEITIATTTIYKLDADHISTGKCNCDHAISQAEWWCGSFDIEEEGDD